MAPYTCNPDTLRNIPEALTQIVGWLGWRAKQRKNGKVSKIPFYINEKSVLGEYCPRSQVHGSAADKRHLVDFSAAFATIISGEMDGIGLAMTPDLNLVAVDLDEGFRPDILDLLSDTYVEKSPSGKGFRAFYWGECPNQKDTEINHVELFHSKGYVTVTGNRINTNDIATITTEVREALLSAAGHTDSQPPTAETRTQYLAETATGEQVAALREALAFIPADDRDLYIAQVYRLKTLGDIGKALCLEWAKTSSKFDPDEFNKTWITAEPDRTGFKAVFKEASKFGWDNHGSKQPQKPVSPPASALLANGQQCAYVVSEWRKHQHYSNRNPAWIKAHRCLLDDVRWHALTVFSQALYLPLILLASEDVHGRLPDCSNIAFRLRRPMLDIEGAIKGLIEQGLILEC